MAGGGGRTYQHGGPQVVLLLELRDEDVRVHHAPAVRVLHLPDHVRHPLEAFLRPRHPDEVHLLAAKRMPLLYGRPCQPEKEKKIAKRGAF